MTSNLLKNNPLFAECVEALNISLLSDEEDAKYFELFEKMFPFTRWGKVNWDAIEQKIEVGYTPENIIPALEKLWGLPIDKTVYIVWDDGGLPTIKANLDDAIKSFDDVRRVCMYTFIFNPKFGYIIEILRGKITVGFVDTKKD